MITTLAAAVVLLSLSFLAVLALSFLRRVIPAPAAGPAAGLKGHTAMLAMFLPGSSVGQPRSVRRFVPHRVTHLTKREAEDLLDWLEATGRPRGRVSYAKGQGFAVSWN